jgi:ATP-binding protein involved in chromosome partitioning
MSISESEIRKAIGEIKDPDLGLTLNELHAIDKISIDNDIVKINIRLIQPIQLVSGKINNLISEVLNRIAPNLGSEINISEIETPQSDGAFLKEVKNIIAVASGKGGVGKSAVAANLAAALSLTGAKVGLLDGDVYGPSQPTMFGLTEERIQAVELPDGRTVAFPMKKYDIEVASMGFVMNRDEAAIIRGPMLAGYFSMLFEQIEWGPLDFLIFDLPPGTGDVQLTLTQKIPLTGAVIVTTPQEISLADVRRSISMFNRVKVDILGIIENMSYFVPPDMPEKKYYIFGKGGGQKIANEASVNLLGEIPLNIAMREGNDGGMPYILREDAGLQGDILKNIAANLVKEIRINNANNHNPTLEISI